jgi:1-aminocyclopropane-1-carboxylate deaminase/D-cysteine desulfhydrase-like pyridoxal-dependent ACC family enzyme
MRDDQIGFGFGGNKIRKLEFLLHEARMLGADTLVTSGSNQSNWCCMTAAAGAVVGMEVHLVLGGPPPVRDTGNIRLARILGASMSHIDSGDDHELERASEAKARELSAAGRRPYRMIVGGSTGLGALGYAVAFGEIAAYARQTGVAFTRIIHATGSAGTQAGLIAGAILHGWQGEIVGIATSRNGADQRRKVRHVLSQVLDESLIDERRIVVDDAFLGGGYRQKTPECMEAIEIFARREGIFLDEVYTGKAAAALIRYGRSGYLRSDDGVLFLHTGGAVQLFE